jgi:AAA+ ATPase superfamily predicted ATPase
MSGTLIDRERERALLLEARRHPPSLVVLIGRRRVGKSFLLASVLNGRRVISFQAEEQDEFGQLELLAREFARVLPGQPPLLLTSWADAIAFLEREALERGPLVVVLDEFQYLCAAQPALPSTIQRAWDRWQREDVPIVLVLSGSALTFMEGLLTHSAPLYGRATQRPFLTPLDYRDAAHFVRSTSAEALLRRYAVLGGTPQYQAWAGDRPLERVVREAILAKGHPLYEDPLHLLREGEGIRDPGTYVAILRAIASGATQYNEIATRAGLATGNLSPRLARLEQLGYVTTWKPLTPGGRERRATYRIADPYFRFFFRCVFPNRSRLDRGRVDEVADEVLVDLDNLMGRAFEDCCRTWVGRYADERAVGANEELGSWWSRDGRVEIDVVGVAKGRCTFLGSCKWSRRVGVHVLEELRDAQATLGGKAATARLAIFARSGFDAALRRRAAEEDVLLVTAADLFR